jgi:signal transduction histidine kinase
MTPSIQLSKVSITRDNDILLARQRCRQISKLLGFSPGDGTRITTALSEIARNAFEYAAGGTVTFAVGDNELDRQGLIITVVDHGEGIRDVAAVLAPGFKSSTGMGIGISGSRALMDRLTITSAPGAGTTVVMAKLLPWSSARFGAADAARLADELVRQTQATPIAELQEQNQALLRALQELSERQAEIDRLRDVADAAQQVAARSLMVRQRFLALTTHEFRTPLNAILGYLDLLALELPASLTETQRSYLARVNSVTRHLAAMTDDFLDMAQDDAGRLTVECVQCVASTVMREAATFVAPQAAARAITLRLVEITPGLTYRGDANRVRQVLINILGNAVSFTPAGGTVELIAERVSESPVGGMLTEGPWCTLRVEDTGPGIPPDKLGHVFEPFVQVSSDGQAARKGSGLGLTVSRQLALLMGGDLTAASSGSGAVFTLWLVDGGAE